MQIGSSSRQGGAAVFVHDRLRWVVPPTDHAALVHWMKRIDEQLRAADWQASGDGTLAEPIDQRIFRFAAQTGFDEPCSQSVNAVLGRHGW